MTLSLTRILGRSLLHRRARSLSALLALTVSAAIATSLLTLYADLEAKLHHEFRSFGANIVVTSPNALPPGILDRARQAAGPDAVVAPFAYAVATTDRGTSVVVVGTDFDAARHLDAWWKVDRWPSSPNEALLGQKAAPFVADEHTLKLVYAGKPVSLTSSGHLSTGGDEESRIYIPLQAFTAWTGVPLTSIELQVPGGADRVEAALTRLRSELPGVSVEPVRQLVEGENRIVGRTHALMFGAVLLIGLTVAVSVLATLSSSVLERRRDFALMKALGGSQIQLAGLFLLEALLLALLGVAAGFVLGSAAAWAIGEINFGTATLPHLGVLPLVLLLNLLIAAGSALVPARLLRGLEPATLLKGD